MSSETLTVGAVATLCQVSRDTVRRWADRGLLPSYRLPSGHRRIERGAACAFRESMLQETGSRAEPVMEPHD